MSITRLELVKEKLGLSVTHEYVYEDRGDGRQRYELPHIVTHVALPLTPVQWMAIAMRETPDGIPECYVGGCCGNMSYCQDIVNSAFRDGGTVDSTALLELGRLMRDHDGEGEDNWFWPVDDTAFAERVEHLSTFTPAEEGSILDPWAVIGTVYLAVEDMLSTNLSSRLTPTKYHAGYAEDRKLLDRVREPLGFLSYADLHADPGADPDENLTPEYLEKETEQKRAERHTHHRQRQAAHRAGQVLAVARLRKPLAQLHEHIQSIDDVFEGWAIVGADDQPLSNGMGQCVYFTREDCEWMIALWERQARENIERDIPESNRTEVPEHRIVPVTITAADGLQITG